MGLHTVAETARLIGVSQVSVYSYIKSGKLEAVIGGDKKKEGQRGTAYKISDQAITDFKSKHSIKGKKEEPDALFDDGHVLQSIFDFNHITISGYAKLRKYGGYAYISSILSGNTAIPKAFIEEFCKYFDTDARELSDMIKLKKFSQIKLRPEYDSPDIHSIRSKNETSITTESDYVRAIVNQAWSKVKESNDEESEEEDTALTFVYYISKSVRTTDNPNETEEVPVLPMSMFSSIDKAKKHLKSLAVRPDYIWINEDGTELIKTSIDKDTLKVTRVHLRIRKCEVS